MVSLFCRCLYLALLYPLSWFQLVWSAVHQLCIVVLHPARTRSFSDGFWSFYCKWRVESNYKLYPKAKISKYEMFYKCRYQRFLFLPKPFSLCIKKQNPALTVVLTSVIPKLRCIFWYFPEMLMGGKKFVVFNFLVRWICCSFSVTAWNLTAKLSYCRLKK